MSWPEHARDRKMFVPPAACLPAAAGILAVIGGIAVTTLVWLCFETANPAFALIVGLVTGGLLLAADAWRRHRQAPPRLHWTGSEVVLEGGGCRRAIAWTELVEVRHLDADVETLELHARTAGEPVRIVLDHFTREQAEEIRQRLRPRS